MKSVFSFVLFSCFFLFLSCKNDVDDVLITVDTDFELDLGQMASFDEGGFEIRFDEVLEDSRCPSDAICVWEGRAWVKLIASKKSDDTAIELITVNSINGDSLLTAEYENYLIELKEVNPYPEVNNPGNEPYSVLFSITEL